MTEYTVSELAKMAGLTVRTLHHYHALDLLKPRGVGVNGYRYYGPDEARRLQQILLHREVGIALKDIGALLDKPNVEKAELLRQHRTEMERRADQTAELIQTLDRRIAELEGKDTMADSELYKGIPPEKQSEYEAWLINHLGDWVKEDITHSRAAFAKLDEAGQAAVMKELEEVEAALAEAMKRGVAPNDPVLDMALNRHRAWVAYMWAKPCPAEAYGGLADLYLAHPDFEKRYEAIASGFTEFLTDAMKAYAARIA